MSKRTPGDWKNDNGVVYAQVGNDEPSFDIFDAVNWNGDYEEGLANADLIAGGPDMQDALRAILLQVVQGKVLERDACIAQARAALAKAEGKS